MKPKKIKAAKRLPDWSDMGNWYKDNPIWKTWR
jgi:hypothetical protein